MNDSQKKIVNFPEVKKEKTSDPNFVNDFVVAECPQVKTGEQLEDYSTMFSHSHFF